MDNDDQQIGRVLSRREVLALLGAGSITMLVGCGPQQGASTATSAATTGAAAGATASPNVEAQTTVAMANDPTAQTAMTAEIATAEIANTTTVPACVVRPEVTEGPYYVEEDLVRSDIRTDPSTGAAKEGVPLVLTFNVSHIATSACTPLQGATVEVWHCDATGAYSDVSDPGFNTEGQKWLRGAQTTDAGGVATFTTIYPGWYSGRAVHIHYKVRPNDTAVFTSQLFFDESLSDQMFAQAPYAGKGQRDTRNSNDSIYQDLMLLTVNKTDTGYATNFDIGIDLSTLGTGESGGGPGGGSPPNGTPGQGGPDGPPPNGTPQPTAMP